MCRSFLIRRPSNAQTLSAVARHRSYLPNLGNRGCHITKHNMAHEEATTTAPPEQTRQHSFPAQAMGEEGIEGGASIFVPAIPARAAEVKKAIKQAKQAQQRAFTAPSANAESIPQDLMDFGFDEKEVKRMMDCRDRSVDAVRPHARSSAMRVHPAPIHNRQQDKPRQAAKSKRHKRSGVRDLVLTNDPGTYTCFFVQNDHEMLTPST